MNISAQMIVNAPLSNLYAMQELQLCFDHLNISANDKVLEIGCGIGFGIIIASNFAKNCVGIDISKPMIELLKKRYEQNNLHFFLLDATEECPKNIKSQFDKVFCIDVMEHIKKEHRRDLVRFAIDSLNSGGSLLTTHPINNLHHGYFINKKDVYAFVDQIQSNFELVYIKFLKSKLIAYIIQQIYKLIQNVVAPSKNGNLFEESTCFRMLQNPNAYYDIIKYGTLLFYQLSARPYIESEPDNGSRALILGVNRK